MRAEEGLDVLAISRSTFEDLTGRAPLLQTDIERKRMGREAVLKLREAMRANNPNLAEMKVRDAVTDRVRTLLASTPFIEVVAHMQREGPGAYAVLDEHRALVGACTVDDLYGALLRQTPLHPQR